MTDGLETAAPQNTAPAPAPVRLRALAGLIDLAPSALLIWLPYEVYPRHGVLLGLLILVAGFTWLEADGGQTPGKRLLGLQVRYLDGSPCDLRAALVRTAFREACSGRPGPVHLDIPHDVLNTVCSWRED